MAQDNERPYTHNAYIFKNYGRPNRQGQRPGWWQLEGRARIEPDGDFDVYLHSTPIGGFNGRIRCIRFDKPQPKEPDWLAVAAAHDEEERGPQRPGGDEDEAEESEG